MSGRAEISITPTPAEYAELVEGLEVLRREGAISNTAAILDAVRLAAYGGGSKEMPRQRSRRSGADTGR